MKPISEITNPVREDLGYGGLSHTRSRSPSTSPDPVATKVLHDCVECLCAIFTGWRAAAGCRSQAEQQAYLDRYARELLAAFRQQKVRTGEEISRGLSEARRQDTDFLPNPGRFARWCKEKQHPSHRAFKRLDHTPDWDAGLKRIRKLKRERAERNAA